MTKSLKFIVPEDVIEKAVDDYLISIFGREVIWYDGVGMPNTYRIEIEEYLEPPLEIDFEQFEVENEW